MTRAFKTDLVLRIKYMLYIFIGNMYIHFELNSLSGYPSYNEYII